MSGAIKTRLIEMLEKPLADEGFALADLVYAPFRNRATIRVFVYGDAGVKLEDCARLSNVIGELLEPTDLFTAGYTLEVSSPGLDRPLTTALDFKYRKGEQVVVEFHDAARKKVTAEIAGSDETQVQFQSETGSFTVPLAEISRAKIVF